MNNDWSGPGAKAPQVPFSWNGLLWSFVYPQRGHRIVPTIPGTVLVGLSVLKAALIIAYFMHLKFERFSLFLTLFPMLIFCILMMLTFMPDSMRALLMRTQ